MKTILLILLLAISAQAQSKLIKRDDFLKPQPVTIEKKDAWRSFGPMTVAATSACVGGQSADIASSTGYEGNSFLRGSNGHMNRAKAIPLKLGLCLAPLLWEKKSPRFVRIVGRIAQFTGGGIGLYDAIHNWKVK